ncbi:MAG: LacI family transcriptional regulator [Proteobacteria bacterium]|nr:LacI family transcriptional regulator [Pseudomonadota bacterium]
MVTMKDVAKAAGVSTATVSAVLAGTSYVSPALKARVEVAVAELGYAPNSMARSLKTGQSNLVGLIVPDITNPFFTAFVDRVQAEMARNSYAVLLGISDNDTAREAGLLGLMRSHLAAGTILCPAGEAERYAALEKNLGGMKLVLADNAAPHGASDTVIIDNRGAALLAARHLISNGHKRIAAMLGPRHRHNSAERWNGFRAAMEEAGLALPDAYVLHGAFREDEAHTEAATLLGRDPLPTAIFVANNLMLIGVMKAVAERRLRVPDDISIVSIDDFAWASAFQPALTVVRQPITAMADAAVMRVIARIQGDQSPPQSLVLPPELLVRGSTRSLHR